VTRVAVVVPCFNAGALVRDAVRSVVEPEPVDVVVIDDASDDPLTIETLAALERVGVRILRLPANGGVTAARNAGLHATRAPYVLPLDADDLLMPGVLARAADRLDADPSAAACVGDYQEFDGSPSVTRAVPARLDPYRVAFVNEYPAAALLRRAILEPLGGWRDPLAELAGYEDWNLWMDLAQNGDGIIHLGETMYRRRLCPTGLNSIYRTRHAQLYGALRASHPALFTNLRAHRRGSDLSTVRRLLYPVVYGDRRRFGWARPVKPWLDRLGIWTLRR
jgi:glycosyltransferase involved in cell wall biosynthesis